MVGVFGRSLSFPNKIPNHRPSQKPPPISHHIRSISLPCRSHPLISQIKDEINDLTTWISSSTAPNNKSPSQKPQTSANLSHGLTRLKDIHDTLEHILHLPQTQESLRRHPLWVEKLLEDFLRFVDAYGIFQTSILSLKEEHSAAQMAVRKRDDSKVVAYIKAKKNMAKQMEKLVSGIRCITSITQRSNGMLQQQQQQVPLASIGDVELVGVIADVVGVTVSVSVALFNGIAASFSSRKLSWTQIVKLTRKTTMRVNNKENKVEGIEELLETQDGVGSLRNLKKKGDEELRSVLRRMMDFESCICGIESASEKVFRALINSRVALLNTLSQ